jgi:hypothetical protein
MAFSLAKNFRAVANTKTLRTLGYNLLGSATYLGVPTITKINGTPGALIGAGSSVALSILTGIPEIAVGGLTTMATHAAYVYLNPRMYAATGTAFFGWSEDSYQMPAKQATTETALNDGTQRLTLPNGKVVEAYPSLSGIPTAGHGNVLALNDVPVTNKPLTLNLGNSRKVR